jgi:hemin uptake protein HemP
MLRGEGTEVRADISDGRRLRGRPVGLVVVALAVVSLVIAAATPSLAAGNTPRRASTSLYKLSLKISSKRLLGDGAENPIAVDRHGNAYTFRATRTQQGSIPSGDAADVAELSPAGKTIRSFSTTFRVRGQRLYMQVDGLAVTPGGHDVFVVGNYSERRSGLVDSKPFLAKYSASTGAFLKGYNFDRDETRLGVGVAVDPTGRHVYVGDERNPFVGRTTARVYEFDVSSLHELRRFRLAGNDVCCDLAVAPDGHLFAQVGPPHSTQVLFQEYGSTGAYESQFISPPGGLAIGPTGDIFAGSRTERRIERLSPSGKLLETLGTGHFTGLPVAGAVDSAGDVYTFDEAKNDVSTILKFAPVVPRTTITAHPPSTLQIPTATFRFKSSIPGAKLECRLRKASASPPAFKPCASPTTYNAQPNGSYTFEARSISPAGPVDRTPARFRFKVRLLYPETVITSAPSSTIGTTTATFAFKSSSAGATFACRLALVGAPPPAFKPCPSPVTYVQLSDGTWKFDVRSISTYGVTDPTPSTYQFTINTTPPIVTAPAAPTIPVGGQLQLDGTLGLQERWTASDTYSPSSDLLYTVEQRDGPTPASLGSFAAIPTLQNSQGTTAAIVPIAPGGPYHQLRVRAENQLGVVAQSPAGDPFRLNVIDDSDASIVYSTGWALTSDTAAYGGKLRTTSTVDSTATMTFSGRSLAIVAPLGPAYGSIRICIDPGVSTAGCTTATLHSTTAVERDIIYVSGPLAAGSHIVQITSPSRSSIALDGFVVLG